MYVRTYSKHYLQWSLLTFLLLLLPFACSVMGTDDNFIFLFVPSVYQRLA